MSVRLFVALPNHSRSQLPRPWPHALPVALPPPNDNITAAALATTTSGCVFGYNFMATTEPFEFGFLDSTVWYAYGPSPVAGALEVTLTPVGRSLHVAYYSSVGFWTSPAPLEPLGDDYTYGSTDGSAEGFSNAMYLPVGVGDVVYAQVASLEGSTDEFNLCWAFTPGTALVVMQW